ncbi:hypothetical protein L1887_25680 [Cichorium endivia]|nr:hypothetical protein L1887_25680 [Cichorium endivia]
MDHKRSTTTAVDATIGGDSLLERIPENLLNEIFVKLEPETLSTLCSLACVSRALQSSVNNVLSSFSSVDLSAFSLDPQTFHGIRRKFGNIHNITLDCLRLNHTSIRNFLGPDIEELNLLKCASLSYRFLSSIGRSCPNLRVLTLEFSGFIDKSTVFDLNFKGSLENCRSLESLKIKIRGGEINDYGFMLLGIYHLLPETIKILKLQPASSLDTLVFFRTVPIPPTSFSQTLSQISLVLDTITDLLLHTITHSLPLLTHLDLKDQPSSDTSDDLSDLGIQSLIHCKHLMHLSLIRIRHHNSASFKRVTDMGFFLLFEGCKQLESVRLSGFTKVSDAGFTSILNSPNLKKFEIQNASLLTDLTFQDVSKVPRVLEEVKLASCNSITSETVCELASCSELKILDLFGCKSVADSCLGHVSKLRFLSYLNLSGADVTDSGMLTLGQGNPPITFLSLRGCKRVTDKGIGYLLLKGKIGKNLSCLDLGHMPGITDSGVRIVVDCCIGLMELCIRNCFYVTNVSMKVLGLKGGIRRVDVYNCSGLTVECFELLKKPLFRGLQWIGIGRTRVMSVGGGGFDEIYRERRWLTICFDGCEVGCHDGWQFHKFYR